MIILFLIGGILTGVFVALLFTKFIGLETFSKKEIFATVLSILVVVSVSGFSTIPQIQFFLIVILLSVIGKIKKHYEKMSLVIFFSFFSVLISSFVNYLEQTIGHILFRPFYASPIFVSMWNILFLVLNIYIAYVTPSVKFEKIYDFLRLRRYLNYIILVILLLLLVFSELSTSSNPNEIIQFLFLNNEGWMYLFLSLGIFILLLLIGLGVHLHENDKKQTLLNSITNYNNEIERLNDELSMFRHDYLNLLHTLKIAIDNKNIEEVEDIYLHVLAPTEKYLKSSEEEVAVLSKIKNIEIKGLISSKLNLAKRNKVRSLLSIHHPIYFSQSTNLETLVRMIGILLDNAIENSCTTNNPYVELNMINQGEFTSITVVNSFDSTAFQKEKLTRARFTTKKDQHNHGLGLSYIQQIVKNSKVYDLETTISDKTFRQELFVRIY